MADVEDEEPLTLLSLPEEVLIIVARHALAAHLRSATHFATQTSRSLCACLRPVLQEASARRLTWLGSHTLRHDISPDGRSLTKTHANGHDCAHAAGPLLPTIGRSAWRVRVECCNDDGDGYDINSMFIGVCDASGRSEWGLDLSTGCIVHLKRNHKGQIVELGDNRASQPLGDSVCLRGRAAGAILEVCVDHDHGTLRFRVDGAPPTAPVAISSAIADVVSERDGRRGGGQVDAVAAAADGSAGAGLALRPYASLGLARSARPDRVSFVDGYRYTPPES
jgi:hypothetical protein